MLSKSEIVKEMFLIPSGRKQVYLYLLYSVQCYRLVHRIRQLVLQKPPRKARAATVFHSDPNPEHCENQDPRGFGMGTSNFCMPLK